MRHSRLTLVGALLFSTIPAAGLGCSGGSEPVNTVGSFNQDPGQPGVNGGPPGGSPSSSTLVVLCTDACVHALPSHCPGQAATAEACESQCAQGGGAFSTPLECSNELAALYVCMSGAPALCPDTSGTNVVCVSETAALKSCTTPGAGTLPGCQHLPAGDASCNSGRQFYECTSPPSGDCIYEGTQAYCCNVP